jgi:CelD/BcsL family acetyltransferase involved in cellulose biosynthesis
VVALDLDDARWTNFVSLCEASTPFHLPAWAKLLADCYGYRAFALGLVGANGEVEEGLPVIEVSSPLGRRRWISLPFTDYCPPLARTGPPTQKLVSGLLEHLSTERVPSFELHAELNGDAFHQISRSVQHTLPLAGGSESVFRSFKKSQVQQPIQKALRAGVSIRHTDSRDDLVNVFYDLHLNTRRRLGVPVQPRRYFELLWERIIAPGTGFLLLGYSQGTPIAGAVFLAANRTVIYKYSASEAKAWNLRANNLLLWTAIRWSADNGYEVFDFGRTEADNEGLRAFKRGWGAKEELLTYSMISDRPPASLAQRGAVLSPVIRHSPRWVTRCLGELLYKYAA